MTGRPEGFECFHQQSQEVQEEFLTMTIKALQSLKTLEATIQATRITLPKTKPQQLCCQNSSSCVYFSYFNTN